MKSLSVLHLDTERSWRGGEAQVLHLAAGLRTKGHDCVVVGQPGSALVARARERGLNTETVLMTSEWSLGAVLGLGRVIRRHRSDVVHMHSSHACTLGGWAARINRVPARIISRRVDFSLRRNPLRRMKYHWGVDRILAISEGIRGVLIEDGLAPARIEVVRSGIDASLFRPDLPSGPVRSEFGIPTGAPVIGCVAHFADHKGHRYLVEAAARLVRERPEIRFILAGEGELKHRIELQVKELGIDNQVIFTGFRKDIPQLLAAMDIVVLSSHLEGLGTSLLDAMAMAKPVVGTRVGGIPEIIDDGVNGVLVPPRDPGALGAGISKLLNDPPLMQQMGAAGRRIVLEKFSASVMVDRTEAVYREILASKGK